MNYKELLNDKNDKVTIILENGKEIKLELFKDVAPITVRNF